MHGHWPLLSMAIWTPIVGGALVLLSGDKAPDGARRIALLFAVVTFLITIPLYTGFDISTASMQFQEHRPWIPTFHIFYFLGVDGISMPLILLTAFMTVLVIIASWTSIQQKVAQYMAAFLIMEGLMIGVFSALDAI
ncbi:MAG: NADH-quinone oxidoreductase subunit M, partial [Gammaproteobacteria bacterium]